MDNYHPLSYFYFLKIGEMCLIGIYCITNLVNNKKYIGQSINIRRRWKEHRVELKANTHCNNYLQNSWNKYGKNLFEFIILEECTEDKLNSFEEKWINYFNSLNKNFGYNLSKVAVYKKYNKNSIRNVRKERIYGSKEEYLNSVSFKNRYFKSGKNNPMYGVHKYGEDAPMYGKKHTEESKQKISKAFKGRFIGENHSNSKISEQQAVEIINKLLNNESLINISKSLEVSYSIVVKIKRKERWTYLTQDIEFPIKPKSA
jgi:group I intron endonuclease